MTTRRDFIIGVAFATCAALGYATTAVLIRKGLVSFAPPMVGAAVSMVFGILMLAIISSRNPESNLRQKKKPVVFMLIGGVFGGLGVMANYFALSVAPVTVVAPISSTTPLFILLFSHLFLGQLEKITLRLVAGTLLIVGGIVLITIGGMT